MAGKFTEDQKQLLKDTASRNPEVSKAAFDEVATALELPLREGILSGDIVTDIFEKVDSENGRSSMEFPVHYMDPGTEGDYRGFSLPNHGTLPQRLIQGDYVTVPLFDIGAVIDWDNKFAKDARWDIVRDAAKNLRGQITKKLNDSGWHTILAAAQSRGISAADTDAGVGEFTPRLISLMKSTMRRNGGGNSASVGRTSLTDLYVSVEAQADMRSWDVDLVDEVTRQKIFSSPDGTINRIFSVNIHDLDELGVGQEYQEYYTNTLSGSILAGDEEIVVGLNKSQKRSFVMPVSEDFYIVPDNTRVRHRQSSLLGFMTVGFAVLDNRDVLIGTL